MKTLSILLWE